MQSPVDIFLNLNNIKLDYTKGAMIESGLIQIVKAVLFSIKPKEVLSHIIG